MSSKYIGCTIKRLPLHLAERAARTACEHNPCNRPETRYRSLVGDLQPQRIALLTTKYWGAKGVKLGVSFLDTDAQEFISLVLSHMNAWGERANVQFAWSKSGGEVRIARTPGQGYWSYLGTDVLHIPAGQPTMNLDSFTRQTPVSEYKRVVRHETGHTLGFPHEHMRQEIVSRINAAKAIAYFRQTQGWSADEVRDQVLTALDPASLRSTQADTLSIMCYALPGGIMSDGQPVPGGLDIDELDYQLAGQVYPLASTPPSPPVPPSPPPPPVSPPPSLGQIGIDLGAKSITAPGGWQFKIGS